MTTQPPSPAAPPPPTGVGGDFPAAFAAQIQRAAARDRLERLARQSWPLAWAVTGAVALLSLLALTTRLAAWGP